MQMYVNDMKKTTSSQDMHRLIYEHIVAKHAFRVRGEQREDSEE